MSSEGSRTIAEVQPLLTTADVARRLGATRRTVRRYAQGGALDAVRINGLLRFSVEDVEALIVSSLVRSGRRDG